jgi:ACT domain-containing protein
MKAIVTVVGKDQKGIIAKVSNILFESSVNIVDISQTIMQDMFTMIMMVEFDNNEVSVADIDDRLSDAGKEMGLSIRVQRQEIFESMHRI